jgi:hypothetical protein
MAKRSSRQTPSVALHTDAYAAWGSQAADDDGRQRSAESVDRYIDPQLRGRRRSRHRVAENVRGAVEQLEDA